MAEANEYKSLAQFVSVKEHTYDWGDVIELRYTNPHYSDTKKEFSIRTKVVDLDEAVIGRITDLSIGDKFCLTTKKNAENPKFNDLVNVTDAKDAPEKKASTWKDKKSWGKSTYDETGVAVGAAWKDSIEILKAGLTVEDVKAMADTVLKAKLEQESTLRASKAEKKDDTTATEKPLSALEKAKLKKQQSASKAEVKPEPEETKAELEDEDIPF